MDKKIKDAFSQITAGEELLEKTEDSVIRQMRRQREKKSAAKWPKVRLTAVVLAALLLLTLIGPFLYNQPVTAVSIDSKETTELYFNRFNRMVDAAAYDENGNPVSEDIDFQKQKFDEVMEEALGETSSEEVYITVASRDEGKSRRLVDDLARHQERMRNMHVFYASEEVMRQAHERGMPMGRMHAMHQLNGEDYEDKSTRELMEAMEKHHKEMMKDGHMPHHKGGPMHRTR